MPATLIQRALVDEPGLSEDPTRERILDAALAEFEAFGLRRTTVEEVTRRAKVGRMTVYRRFPGKESLVEAVILREAGRFFAEVDEVVARQATLETQLIEGFVFGVTRAREHALVGRLLETEPEALLPYLTLDAGPLLEIARDFLVARLLQSPEAGGLGEKRLRSAADAATRIAHSLVLTRAFEEPRALRAFARSVLPPLVAT